MTAGFTFHRASGFLCKTCLLLLLVAGCFPAFSQKDLLPQADKLFAEKRYSEAIPLYSAAYEKKKERPVLLKLADANFLNENFTQAERYYAEYFRDTVFEDTPQFVNYARSARISGKITRTVKLYEILSHITQDPAYKETYELYKLYTDSFRLVRSFNLDSNYKCVTIDASGSVDTLAPPMSYSWDFDDGGREDGLKVEHCFAQEGDHNVVLNVTDRKSGLVRHRDTMLLITIERLPVSFAVSPKIAKRYFTITLDASETELPGYEIIDYLWDLDNGETSSGKKIKYKYNDSRDYWVRLTIIAKDKATGQKKLFSANRKVAVVENYETPGKKFEETLNGAK